MKGRGQLPEGDHHLNRTPVNRAPINWTLLKESMSLTEPLFIVELYKPSKNKYICKGCCKASESPSCRRYPGSPAPRTPHKVVQNSAPKGSQGFAIMRIAMYGSARTSNQPRADLCTVKKLSFRRFCVSKIMEMCCIFLTRPPVTGLLVGFS